jgi:hypothetical protein
VSRGRASVKENYDRNDWSMAASMVSAPPSCCLSGAIVNEVAAGSRMWLFNYGSLISSLS